MMIPRRSFLGSLIAVFFFKPVPKLSREDDIIRRFNEAIALDYVIPFRVTRTDQSFAARVRSLLSRREHGNIRPWAG